MVSHLLRFNMVLSGEKKTKRKTITNSITLQILKRKCVTVAAIDKVSCNQETVQENIIKTWEKWGYYHSPSLRREPRQSSTSLHGRLQGAYLKMFTTYLIRGSLKYWEITSQNFFLWQMTDLSLSFRLYKIDDAKLEILIASRQRMQVFMATQLNLDYFSINK